MEKLKYSPGQLEHAQLCAFEPVTALERGDARRWELARAVLGDGAASGLLLAVRTRGGACTMIALELPEGCPADQPAIEQIRELGNRVGVAFDAADWENKRLEEARNDSLTGLPNRLRIHEIIEERLAAAEAPGSPFAILFIDLDRFKGVNDGLGHDAGDALLVQAAQRIRQCVLPQDVVARLGGDEFIVLTADVATDSRTSARARAIIAALTAPYRIGLAEVHVSASIGMAFFPNDGATREALIRNADTAMYRAKEQGRGRWVYYQEAMSRAAVEVLSLEKDLRAARYHPANSSTWPRRSA